MKRIFVWFGFLCVVACASSAPLQNSVPSTSSLCRSELEENKDKTTDVQLDSVRDLYRQGCYYEVITLANFIRTRGHDKFYSITAETAEIFSPEGSFTPYVLESYERSILSLLISFSYLSLKQTDNALIELRRASVEDNAWIYNHGEDPVVTLLLAALWDRLDPAMARPEWLKLSRYKNMNTSIADFARARIQEIDANGAAVAWQIYGLGELPELDWHSQFFSARPYKIEPRSDFPPACVSAESVLIPTHSWVEKIAARYDSSYHPWLFTKSLLRWPVGVGYGVVTATSGVAVGVGGCGLAAGGGQGFNAVCEASVRGAGYLIGKSADLVSFTLKPDLRRWKNLPSAVVIQRGDETVDSCLPSAAAETLSDRLI